MSGFGSNGPRIRTLRRLDWDRATDIYGRTEWHSDEPADGWKDRQIYGWTYRVTFEY